MITIITGVPGMGKTAMIVQMMLEEQKKGQRPFFVMGIPELTIDHSPVPPVVEWTEKRPDKDDPSVLLDYYTFPPNSIIIIDEAQRVFRPRASGSKVPPHVAAQETHRHTGVDFWLATQKPSLLDSNIRELCGRHIHLKNTILGRKLYEWPEYQDVNSKSNLQAAVKRSYAPPKEAFAYYKSSELHTKQKTRFHQAYLVLGFALLTVSFLGYRLYTGLYQKIKNDPQPIEKLATTDEEKALIKAIDDSKKQPLSQPELQPAVYNPEPVHPYIGYQFTIKGTIQAKSKTIYYFLIQNQDGHQTFTNSDELKTLGYSLKYSGHCAAFLYFEGASVVATCEGENSPSQNPSVLPVVSRNFPKPEISSDSQFRPIPP